jgi:F-type H+-transporting ATPase subunit b
MGTQLLRRTALAAALAVALAAPSVVSAADEHGAPAEGHGGAKGKADFIDIKRYDLGIYTLVVFGTLFYILRRYAWGPFLGGLAKREERILHHQDEAKKARDEAQAALAELQSRHAKANDEIRALLDEARRDAQTTREKILADARTEAQGERERVRREIEAARDQALQDIWQQSVQLATMVSAKTIRRNLSNDDHARFLDEALVELKQGLKEAKA